MVVDLSSLDETDAGCSDGWGSVWIACGSDVSLRLGAGPIVVPPRLTAAAAACPAQVHQLQLAPTPFLRTFQAALVRTFDLSKVELNDLSLSPDGKQLAWCGDDGRLGVCECRLPSFCFRPRALLVRDLR